jgi:hypothetical protein
MLVRISRGVHVDLSSGTVRFFASKSDIFEVHAEEAMIRSQDGQAADATISILQPKLLEIQARRGSLNFTHRQGFRTLPEGQTYRIYLDSPERTGAEPAGGASAGGSSGNKVTYHAIHSGNQPISPAQP